MQRHGSGKSGLQPFMFMLRIRLRTFIDSPERITSFILYERKVHVIAEAEAHRSNLEGWTVFQSGGFATEIEAKRFGLKLKRSLAISAVKLGIALDVGDDEPSGWINPDAFVFMEAAGVRPKISVHGLDTSPDDDRTQMIVMNGPEVRVGTDTSRLFAEIGLTFSALSDHEPAEFKAVLLMNAAWMSRESLASLVLSLSAVEMLAREGTWSVGQSVLREQVLKLVKEASFLPVQERDELYEAIEKVRQVSIRRGVKLLLTDIGMLYHLKEWDKLYSARSAIFHGRRILDPDGKSALASGGLQLCARIILSALGRSVAHTRSEIDRVDPSVSADQTP